MGLYTIMGLYNDVIHYPGADPGIKKKGGGGDSDTFIYFFFKVSKGGGGGTGRMCPP